MKNREKFAKEILDIACSGGTIAIDKSGNLVDCRDLICTGCTFGKALTCKKDELIPKWCESEYVEKPTITSREKKFLNMLLPKSKYIARDENDKLYVYTEKPKRVMGYWGCPDGSYQILADIFGNMFDFIKWEDEEPWHIEDLKKLECEEYETD